MTKLRAGGGAIISDRRIEIMVKYHHDNWTSVFTDRIELLKKLLPEAELVDIHVK